MKVLVASNVTDSITVRWMSPMKVDHRVDRYYILYWAVDSLDGEEMIIKDVVNSDTLHEVNLLSFLLIFTSENSLVV